MRKSLPSDPYNPTFEIPNLLEISWEQFEKAYPTWRLWRAFDRKITPTEIRKQPDTLLMDLLYIDSVFEEMVGQRMEQYRKRQEASNG